MKRSEEIAPETQPKRSNSLVLTVLAVLLVVGLVPLALMGFQVARSLAEDLEANQKEIQLDKAKTIEQEISRYIDGHFDRLEGMATAVSHLASPSVDGVRPFNEVAFRELLEEYVGRHGVLELRLAFADGTTPNELRVNWQNFDSDGIRDDLMPLVEQAREKGRRGSRFLSSPFLPVGKPFPHALAVLAVPLRSMGDGKPGSAEVARPVLVATISMAPIQQAVHAIGGSGQGYTVFVLGEDLRPFAHTDFSQVVAADSMADHVLVGRGLQPSPFSTTVEQAGGNLIGTYHPVALDDQRWGVFVQVDRAMGLVQVADMRNTTIKWGVLAFGLALVIGVVFSWRVTGPIHELAESTRRVARGDYTRRVKIARNNELGMLADNFNQMAGEIGKTIDDLKIQKEINDQLFLSSIRSLAAAIDARDPYTRGHSERVTRYARVIARQLKLTPEQIRSVEIGALLHDVGKIGIEDRILRKPAALTPEEFEIMKTHPEKGGAIMEPISHLREVTEIIIHHHERFDGGGYPSGLKAEEIPIGARVVNVADTFDAMTTNRPYQRAMTFTVAARKIGEFAGKACDPAVVKAFHEAFESGKLGVVEATSQTG